MSDIFLHGVETIEAQGLVLVNDIKTAVIGLIGTAITGDINSLKLCVSEADDEQFGATGTIPEALKVIRKQWLSNIQNKGAATIFVINIGLPSGTYTAPDFAGTYDDETGVRTGLKLLDTCFSTYGFNPKILIAPRFSGLEGVISALETTAQKFRAEYYLDAPSGVVTQEAAIALKASSGLWSNLSERAFPCFPELIDADDNLSKPLSAILAGVRTQADFMDETQGGGFFVSISNKTIRNVSALSVPLTASINDPQCDVNKLNAVGIITVFNSYGTGFRTWGNRAGNFPLASGTDIENVRTFESVRRTADIVDESIELAMLPYCDKNIIQAFIDDVKQTVNNYYNSLIKRGALMEGSKCSFNKTLNPDTELAKGHVIFTNNFMSSVPAERITFNTKLDINLLNSLK